MSIYDGSVESNMPPRLGERQVERDLSGKVAIVTGASRGIGKQAALALARRGANVAIAARTVDPHSELSGTLGEAVAEIEDGGGDAIAVATELSEEEDLRRLVQSTVDRFGGVDILINNAAVTVGHNWAAPIVEMPRADWLYHFAVNLHAPFTLVQLVAPIMEKRGGGRILNVTTAGEDAFRQPEEPPTLASVSDSSLESPAYFSSKSALDRLSNIIAAQLARKNIAIISMHPGFVASEIAVQRVQDMDIPEGMMIPMDVPARMLAYFAACENPLEYSGRIFRAERELSELGIEVDTR